MALEIERRFFVASEAWQELSIKQEQLDQGYLSEGQAAVVVRVRRSQEQAWLTLKAHTSNPEIRQEFEYPIPPADADALLALTTRRVEKTRHHLNCPGGEWVVDVFAGANAPLVIAEVERRGQGCSALVRREITGRGELHCRQLCGRAAGGPLRGNRFSPIVRFLELADQRL